MHTTMSNIAYTKLVIMNNDVLKERNKRHKNGKNAQREKKTGAD